MYARSTTMFGNPHALHDAVAYMRDEVLPALLAIPGCIGLSMLCERCSGRMIATSAWETQEAMRASAEPVHPLRTRLVQLLDGRPDVQEWEIAVLHREHVTVDGAATRVTWVRCPPDLLDRVLDGYRSHVMPRMNSRSCETVTIVPRNSSRARSITSIDAKSR